MRIIGEDISCSTHGNRYLVQTLAKRGHDVSFMNEWRPAGVVSAKAKTIWEGRTRRVGHADAYSCDTEQQEAQRRPVTKCAVCHESIANLNALTPTSCCSRYRCEVCAARKARQIADFGPGTYCTICFKTH